MMKVAPLRYGVIFKKAFSVPAIFNAFAQDVIGVAVEQKNGVTVDVDLVETEKSFERPVGTVDIKFDLYAEDLKNRVIVDIQHERLNDHYSRFFHYACAAILEQVRTAGNYRPDLTVYTLVVLTSGDRHKKDVSIIDTDPHDLKGNPLKEIPHKVIYICPKYVNDETPEIIQDWLRAIDDSLDGEVDEQAYTRPEIRQIFDLIQEDTVTPTEKWEMIEEYHQKELQDKEHEAGLKEGTQTQAQKSLIRQLKRKFTDIPPAILTQIKETEDVDQLDAWLDALFDVDSLEEMGFGEDNAE